MATSTPVRPASAQNCPSVRSVASVGKIVEGAGRTPSLHHPARTPISQNAMNSTMRPTVDTTLSVRLPDPPPPGRFSAVAGVLAWIR